MERTDYPNLLRLQTAAWVIIRTVMYPSWILAKCAMKLDEIMWDGNNPEVEIIAMIGSMICFVGAVLAAVLTITAYVYLFRFLF